MTTGAKTELTLFRAMRANFCVSRTNEIPGAFKLSATSEFTWRREFQSPSDARIFRTVELQVGHASAVTAQFGICPLQIRRTAA